MVKIRLRRKGRIHYPFYDIVALDSRKRRDGAFIEKLGYYNPNTHPSTISVDPDRVIYWLSVGAQPSNVVSKILSYEGILLRRALAFKGKNQVEIESEVEKHKLVVQDRYKRRKELRKKRVIAKAKAAEQAKEDAAIAAAAPTTTA